MSAIVIVLLNQAAFLSVMQNVNFGSITVSDAYCLLKVLCQKGNYSVKGFIEILEDECLLLRQAEKLILQQNDHQFIVWKASTTAETLALL